MQGLPWDKMAHPIFKSYQTTEDLIFLQECHGSETQRTLLESTLDTNWKIGAYVEQPDNEQGHNKGGTTIMLQRKDLDVTMSRNQGPSKNDDFLWVTVGDTEVGCIYLRPDNRTKDNLDVGRTFSDFQDHLLLRTAMPEARILVLGDHNVRTGSLQTEGFSPRQHEDDVVRGRGKNYLNVLREGRLGILNGAIGTDKLAGGKTTRHGTKTHTTIDYALASASILDAHDIADFEIFPYDDTLSDHCAIRVTVAATFLTAPPEDLLPAPTAPITPHENRNPISDPRERPPSHADAILDELLAENNARDHNEANESQFDTLPMGEFEEIAGATIFHKSGRADNAKTRKAWDKLLKKAKDIVASKKLALAHQKLAAETALSKTKSIAERWKQRHKREIRRLEFGKAVKSERHFHEVYKRIINGKQPDRLPDNVAQEKHAAHSHHYEGMGIILDPPFHNTTARDAAIDEEINSPKVTYNTADHPLHRTITRAEVVKALEKTAGRRTASGPDRVSWAQIETMDVDILTKLFQWCLDHNEVPNVWLIAHIVPIAKKTTNVNDPSTYRGITLESCLLKLLTTLLAERLNEWILTDKGTNVLPDNQGGFRPGYRTEANILTLDHILAQARRAGKDVYVAFVDLKKAFDTVSRGLLWHKLRLLGCSGKVFDLIRTLYSGLHTMVRLGSFTGEIFKGEVGVAQGDPLSGILWDIYLHDFRLQEFQDTVHIGAHAISHLLFADDIALVSTGGPQAIQNRINELTSYCNLNCLTISAPKTVVVKFPFASSVDTDATPIFFLTNGEQITEIDHATYIGICFESNKPDRFHTHFATLYRKAKFVAFGALALQRVIGVIKMPQAIKFCTERIHSRLLFGSEVTFHAPAPDHDKLVLTYLRRTLSLPDQCTVNGVYTTTGTYPLAMLKLERAAKFYSYLERSDAPVFARAALLEMRSIIVPAVGKGSRQRHWLSHLTTAVQKRGLILPQAPDTGYPTRVDSQRASDIFCSKLRAQERQSLFDALHSNDSAQLLCSPGSWFGLQTYLTACSAKDRMVMSRLRFKMDNLGKQVGRRHHDPPTPRENRICAVCDTGEVESALHMLMDCDGHEQVLQARGELYAFVGTLEDIPSCRPTIYAAQKFRTDQTHDSLEALWYTLLNTRNKHVSLRVTKFACSSLAIFMTYERRFSNTTDAHEVLSDKIEYEAGPEMPALEDETPHDHNLRALLHRDGVGAAEHPESDNGDSDSDS